jgi:hypothetical protein
MNNQKQKGGTYRPTEKHPDGRRILPQCEEAQVVFPQQHVFPLMHPSDFQTKARSQVSDKHNSL